MHYRVLGVRPKYSARLTKDTIHNTPPFSTKCSNQNAQVSQGKNALSQPIDRYKFHTLASEWCSTLQFFQRFVTI